MLAKTKNYIKKQAFYPTAIGIFVNPFYIARKNLLRNIENLSDHFNGGYLLDVGCGTKPYEPLFNVDSYIGLDVAGGGHSDGAKYSDVYYNGKEFPFKDSFFDYVISNEVLEHVFEPEKFMGEIHRVLKPDGYFWSFHIAKGSWGYGTGNLIDYETFDNLSEGPLGDMGVSCIPSNKDLETLLLNRGFKINGVEKYSLTHEHQRKEIIHWIIEARRM